MSTDFSIRPVGARAPSPVVQSVSQASGNAVATDLPANQSVTAADASTAARNDPQMASQGVSHQAHYDRTAGVMVYQVVNEKADQFVDQYPDDTVLRRRAHFYALDMRKHDLPRAIRSDLVA
jgi:hypothetical protein